MIQQSGVIWFTGLSGAGKTTIANALFKDLKQSQNNVILLDGDVIRSLFQNFGFDEEARKKHNIAVGEFAALLEKQGHWVIVAMISPYADTREIIRNKCINFIEVYVSTSLQVCQERDPKGLYKKAISGEIKDFTGISAPYFAPTAADVEIDTANESIANAIEFIKLKLI